MGSFLVFGPLLEIITTEKISMDTLPTLAVAKNPDEIKRKWQKFVHFYSVRKQIKEHLKPTSPILHSPI